MRGVGSLKGSGGEGGAQRILDPDRDFGRVLSKVVMWCWSRWSCGLLVRTGIYWDSDDLYRTVRTADKQVGFI